MNGDTNLQSRCNWQTEGRVYVLFRSSPLRKFSWMSGQLPKQSEEEKHIFGGHSAISSTFHLSIGNESCMDIIN